MRIMTMLKKLLPKSEDIVINEDEVHNVKASYTEEIQQVKEKGRQMDSKSTTINMRLESTAQRIFRATQGERNGYLPH